MGYSVGLRTVNAPLGERRGASRATSSCGPFRQRERRRTCRGRHRLGRREVYRGSNPWLGFASTREWPCATPRPQSERLRRRRDAGRWERRGSRIRSWAVSTVAAAPHVFSRWVLSYSQQVNSQTVAFDTHVPSTPNSGKPTLGTEVSIAARVTDISKKGCYVDLRSALCGNG
jgi:hypothetical protein